MRIIAIEDQPIAAMMLLANLQALGHEVEQVQDSSRALERIVQGEFRVVVSDWMMPEINGLELCRKVRESVGAYIYFILVSSQPITIENRQKALAAGVDDFLVKPVDLEELGMRLHVAERIIRMTVQINQLESFIPICGYCKKIRDDKKYWQDIESYFSEKRGPKFSHGICPDCYTSVMVPQFEKLGISVPPFPANA